MACSTPAGASAPCAVSILATNAGDGDDARSGQDRCARKSARKARAIQAFHVLMHHLGNGPGEFDAFQQQKASTHNE
jgi:hypothetical protein